MKTELSKSVSDDLEKKFNFLRTKLITALCHMNLYYYKSIKNDEFPFILNGIKNTLFQAEGEASKIHLLLYIRNVFGSNSNNPDKNVKSLFTFYQNFFFDATFDSYQKEKLRDLFKKYEEGDEKKKTKNKDNIIKNILVDDKTFKSYKKCILSCNKEIAHWDAVKIPKTSYGDIENVLSRIKVHFEKELHAIFLNGVFPVEKTLRREVKNYVKSHIRALV